jgi:anthranilate phosphoribosyltransferase
VELNIARARLSDLLGGTPEENAAVVRSVFDGEHGPVRDIVLLNAAAGLVAYDLYKQPSTFDEALLTRMKEKMSIAAAAIDSGAALAKLHEWAQATQSFS